MIQMTITMFSQALQRHTEVLVAFPPEPGKREKNRLYDQRPVKTLLLLHGYNGSGREFMLTGNVQNLAAKYNVAIVCPNGENSFYLNQKGTGRAYGDFFGKELPAFLRQYLGLCAAREDTMIGGFSMRGFGALHVGLSHPKQFGGIIAVSSALVIYNVAQMKPGDRDLADYDYYKQTFGEPKKVLQSTNNPEVLLISLQKNGGPIPPIYMACGTEDMLLEYNRRFAQFLTEYALQFHFDQQPGGHDRDFGIPYLDAGLRYQFSLQKSALC